jgi:hypothetical protein
MFDELRKKADESDAGDYSGIRVIKTGGFGYYEVYRD